MSTTYMSVYSGYADLARVSNLEIRLEWPFDCTFLGGKSFFLCFEYNGTHHELTKYMQWTYGKYKVAENGNP